jgi:Lon protease-like protein
MSAHGGRPFEISDLPQSMPIFPLTGALLLPDGHMPLNIFEPRYLAMIEDALMARDRLIGMIQPRDAHAEGMTRGNVIPPSPELYPTGCAGRIINFTETDDGRYLITLRGLCRFNLREEMPTTRGYRRIVPDFSQWHADLKPATETGDIDRDRLLRSLRTYFAARSMKVEWDAVMQTPNDRLITLLSMMCPFAPQEKQALLEAPALADRAQAIITLIEMGATGHDDEIAKH